MPVRAVPVLILFGAPGAGKGSLAAYLADDHGFVHLSTGAVLRAWAAGSSPEQVELRARLAAGQFATDGVAARIVAETIAALPASTPAVILDGYPRNLSQLAAWRAAGGTGRAILLTISEQTAVERLGLRGTCPRDGTGSPGVGKPCPRCGTPTVRRDDDAEIATIRARFATYRATTAPVASAWRAAGLPLTQIDGDISLPALRRLARRIAASFKA